jgi:hypothetical protein
VIDLETNAVPAAVQPVDFFKQVGNVFVKLMYLRLKGESTIGHSHAHDHITLLAHGSVLVKVDLGPDEIFNAPAFIDVRKGTHHQFIALTDETVLACIHDTHGLDIEDLGKPFVRPSALTGVRP